MASPAQATNHGRVHLARFLAIAALALFSTGAAGATAPQSFHLVFDGKHNAALLHEGPFTTSSSWCAGGSAVDLSFDLATATAMRQFSCGAGGRFTAKVWPLPAEHGGSGSWQIVAGDGPLAELRGKGTFTSTRLSGSPNDPSTITFRSTWDGIADLDVSPPTAGIRSSSVQKLTRPKGAYRLRLVLSLTDNDGSPVSYELQVVDPRRPSNLLVYRLGKAATGTVTSSFRIEPRPSTRFLRIKIGATDAVGNRSAFAKKLRLR